MTPGHTPGSMCFLVDDKYLFTGDTFVLPNDKAEKFVKLFTIDENENIHSIRNLANNVKNKQIEYIFTAHHGYSDDSTKVFEKWI